MRLYMPALPDFFSLLNPAQPPETQLKRTFVGAINDTIPVTLTITTTGRLAHGTLIYTRSGISILVVGTLTDNNLLLHEFDKRGNIMGIHAGELSKTHYSGTWHSPSLPGRPLLFTLIMTSQYDEPKLRVANLTGIYQYGYGTRNRFGQLYIQQMGEKMLAIAMLAATDEPVQNQIVVPKIVTNLSANQAIFSTNSLVMAPLKIAFFNGGATVCFAGPTTDNTSQQPVTRLAHMLLGQYIRTSTQPPRFSVDELSRVS